jgi:hypothetical protein
MDLRYPPLSPTAAPMTVYQNLVCVSLGPLDVRPPLILVNQNPGIAESLLTVGMFTVDLVQNPSNSHRSAMTANESS